MRPTRHNLTQEQFEGYVEEALASLPPAFQEAMDNVAIVTRLWPTPAELRRAGLRPGHTLLGLYHGIPLTERTRGYNLVAPDTITLYQGPIEDSCPRPDALPAKIRHVIIHEIAHHFGISDERLRELGAY